MTPNLPEAEQLTGIHGTRLNDLKEAAKRIVGLGARSVVIKGGHRKGPATDLFYDGKKFRSFSAARIPTSNTHGTGCTFSAAITANLAKDDKLEQAVAHAKTYMTRAIRKSFSIGAGHSPVHHFHNFWNKR